MEGSQQDSMDTAVCRREKEGGGIGGEREEWRGEEGRERFWASLLAGEKWTLERPKNWTEDGKKFPNFYLGSVRIFVFGVFGDPRPRIMLQYVFTCFFFFLHFLFFLTQVQEGRKEERDERRGREGEEEGELRERKKEGNSRKLTFNLSETLWEGPVQILGVISW
jgi:hypothetical protein